MQSQKPKNNHIKLRAYAKINPSLKVAGKRADGYHDIDSIMQSVSLHDEVEVREAPTGVSVKCSPAIAENIAEKAAKLFLDEIKLVKGVEISIKKHIPVASGLGGGSANAAAAIIGIDHVLGLNLHRNKLMEIGAKIGSDVPFCIVGGTCRVTGRGDKVEKANPHSSAAFILVIPKFEVPTGSVYEEFDRVGAGKNGNDLELAASKLFPEIKNIKDSLVKATGGNWKMSGSGPSLFMELSDISESEKHVEAIRKLGLEFHVVKRMDSGVETIN
jgi:4-diphosphocytidyl-2-C-methyl-D-erythritol kinase